MNAAEEEKYIQYWEANRDNEAKLSTQLLKGIPKGLLFAVPVFLLLVTARYWYRRADMVANTQLNPIVFSLAIFLIVVFIAVFHKKHQWDRKEQQYLEFKARKDRMELRHENQPEAAK